MPEMPEVETVAKGLLPLVGETVDKVNVNWKKSFSGDPNQLLGLKIKSVSRRGKYIKIEMEKGGYLFIHLRMSGRISLEEKTRSYNKHEHVVITFKPKWILVFHDTRKFGRMDYVNDPSIIESKLGVEPFEIVAADIIQALNKKKRALKPLLLDQSFISGLGNIYVDEALFEAKLHPQTLASSLSNHEASHLIKAIQACLRRGIDSQGTSLGKGKGNYSMPSGMIGNHQNLLKVFRKTGEPCPNCGTKIERIIVAQRSTHICKNCQLKRR